MNDYVHRNSDVLNSVFSYTLSVRQYSCLFQSIVKYRCELYKKKKKKKKSKEKRMYNAWNNVNVNSPCVSFSLLSSFPGIQ